MNSIFFSGDKIHYHNLHRFTLYYSVESDLFTRLCIITMIEFQNIFNPKKKPHPREPFSPPPPALPPFSQALATTHLFLSQSICLFWTLPWKWNPTTWELLCLASSVLHHVVKVPRLVTKLNSPAPPPVERDASLGHSRNHFLELNP